MGVGRFRISYARLKELLYLPNDAEIIGIDPDWPGGRYGFYLHVEHKGLPALPEDGCVPEGEIIFKRNSPVEFVEWKMYE